MCIQDPSLLRMRSLHAILLAVLLTLLMVSFALQKPSSCLLCLLLLWGNAQGSIKELCSYSLTVVCFSSCSLVFPLSQLISVHSGVARSSVITSACWHPVSPAPLWKRLPSPDYTLPAPLPAASTANSWASFWAFRSVLFVYILNFVPAPSCLVF